MTVAKVIFASLTGNTEEVAEIVTEAFEEAGIEVTMEECTQVDAKDFLDADICVVATYTYGDGELPDEIFDFNDELKDLDLAGKIYGVVGTGDSFYEHFCRAVDDFAESFEKTGAKKGAESVKIENAVEEEGIAALQAFAKELVAAAKES